MARSFSGLVRRLLVHLAPALGAMALAGPGMAWADAVTTQPIKGIDRNLQAIEELSYETIIEPSQGYDATLRLRLALHNTSALARDTVITLALPRASQLEGARAARNGVWSDASITTVKPGTGRRDPGTVFVRALDRKPGGLPRAEIVAFAVPSEATLQIELILRVHPKLRGGRWQLELPSRGRRLRGLAQQRRVLVAPDEGSSPAFWVDEVPSRDRPMMLTRPDQPVTVEWPADLPQRSVLDVHYETRPDDFGGGEFRLILRMGATPAPKPDHLTLVLDRSRSASARMQREAYGLFEGLLQAAPEDTTYDAIGFAREATPLLSDDTLPQAGDAEARLALQRTLDANVQSQGTNLASALALAARRLQRIEARRPMIVIVTDGMLPSAIDSARIRASFDTALKNSTSGRKRNRPEILFVVDEPMLLDTGLPADHPVARAAAALGARISLEPLTQLHSNQTEILRSPRVLGNLAVDLPDHMRLRTEMPPGLVAGTVAVLEGNYRQKPARRLRVHGSLGERRIIRRVRGRKYPALPDALVGVVDNGDQKRAASEGFVRPSWYGPRQQRLANIGIDQAGRGYGDRQGTLDRKIVKHYLRTRVLPRARVCYNHALARNQVQKGRIVLEIELGKGEVMFADTTGVELDDEDEQLVQCLTEAAWALEIPAAKLDDKAYLVRYPLTLVPPKDGVAPTVSDPLGEGTVDLLLDAVPSPG